MKNSLRLGAFAFLGLLAACTSVPVTFDTGPIRPDEEIIGRAEGTSTGFMLFQFIPINQNKRFESAYKHALNNSMGTRLTDVTISERWFWAYVGNGYIFKVQGTAVRPRSN